MEMESFKPRKTRISSSEKSELFKNNLAWCAGCKEVKNVSEMTLNKTKEFGLGNNCKCCENSLAATRREANRLKKQLDSDYAEAERLKEREYRRAKRVEESTSIKSLIIDNPLNFKPAGLKVSNRESEALRIAGYKWCAKCSTVNPLEEFYNGASYCRSCMSLMTKGNEDVLNSRKTYYIENRDAVLNRVRTYRKNNPEAIRLSKMKYSINNPDKERESRDRYRSLNIDKIRAKQKEHYHKNIKAKKEYDRKYRIDNAAILRDKLRDRYNSDRDFRLRCICRSILRRALKYSKSKKTSRTFELLGYTNVDLINHIESLFQPGMSWDNYGEWHIDHKIPICTAKTFEDGIRLSQLDNLQPLWEADNLSKGSKILYIYKDLHIQK